MQDPIVSFLAKTAIDLPGRKKEIRNVYDAKQTLEKKAELFWGEEMHVLLPEEVSGALYSQGHVEPRLSHFFYTFLRPGDVFIDVGAHIGYFSRLAAHKVGETGKVISIEPMPTTFEWLSKNVSDLQQISKVNAAVWNQNQSLEFQDYGFVWSAYSTAYEARLPKEFLKTLPRRSVQVQAIQLDGFVQEQKITPTVVKIDAESAELQVLEGMQNYLLQTVRPVITVEVGDMDVPSATLSRDVISWLTAKNYTAFEFHNGSLNPHCLQDRYPYDNIIFFPNSRIEELTQRLEHPHA